MIILKLIFLSLIFSQTVYTENKPNVLMLVIDDLNDWVGPLKGHPQVKTPSIDALAARGTVFSNAHCQTPLCNPSRTSFMTSLRPSTTGIYGLRPWFRDVKKLKDLVTLPQYFSKAGYTTYTIGKIYHRFNNSDTVEFNHVGIPEKSLRVKKKRVNTPRGGPGMDWGLYPYKDSDHKDWKTADWAVNTLNKKPAGPFFMAVAIYIRGSWLSLESVTDFCSALQLCG